MSTSKFLLAACAALSLSACSSSKVDEWFTSHTGNMPSEERIAQISKGDSQDKVLDVLGAPSGVVSLDKNTWIYMSSAVRRIAFMAPTEVDRDVLTIRFDNAGRVVEITRLDKECGQEVNIIEDETEAPGQDPGFFRKYFGGVGQYNPLSGIGNRSDI
ncbi:MAG: outer membrane protein assembly factor BamE [Alphaproteobacteria bacterium]|nr:outer membrane protein assembly factor BamE [Alphaproteobacteria bacterium]